MKKAYINPKTKSIEITESLSLLQDSGDTTKSRLFFIDPNIDTEEIGEEQWVKRYKGVFGDEEW